MSNAIGGFLFGNIDEEGKLDNEDFDEELRANLTTFSERIQDKKILLDDLVAEDLINELDPNSESKDHQNTKQQKTNVIPLPEAVNFEDITELADAAAQKDENEEALPRKRRIVAEALVEPLHAVGTISTFESTFVTPQFDSRQILKFTRLSGKPALLNATGRSYSRYAALRRYRLKRKHLHGARSSANSAANGHSSLAENQLESFLTRNGPSLPVPSSAAARLRLSLINLNSSAVSTTMNSVTKNAKKPWLQSLRYRELEKALLAGNADELDIIPQSFSTARMVKMPDNSHFHPLSLIEWENQVIWEENDGHQEQPTSFNLQRGMFVNLATITTPPNSSNSSSSSSSSTGQSQQITSSVPNGHSLNSPSGASLSSILSSLSLSNGALGGDSANSSATATALLALIRNQQMRSASISSGSLSSARSTVPLYPGQISRSVSSSSTQAASVVVKLKYPKASAARIRNQDLDSGDWTKSIIWTLKNEDSFDNPNRFEAALANTHLILPMDDPGLIFKPLVVENLSKKLGRAEKLIAKRIKKLQNTTANGYAAALNSFSRPIVDKFNLSNDKYYENSTSSENDPSLLNSSSVTRGTTGKPSNGTGNSGINEQGGVGGGNKSTAASSSRSSVSAAFLGLHHSVPALQHSVPALKLAPPAFQTCRTKRELRLWHRARMALPTGYTIGSWLRVRTPNGNKKNNSTLNSNNSNKTVDLSGNLRLNISCDPSGGIIRSSKKLTLKDSSRFVLLEYSEEFPPLLMNPGMGAYIVLYYRKKSPQDTHVPSSTFALVQVLDFTDPSPFWMFGDVPAGTFRYALCNGLFRAPLFSHRSPPSDFIIARHHEVGAEPGTPEFYLRPLESAPVLLVGQEFPLVEVPGPHSRRHNMFCRQRLQVAAYRLFNKDPLLPDSGHSRKRLKIGRLLAAFPQFSEGSIRKWLKEYSESTRTGKDSGVWLLKNDAPQLEEDELRVLVTPEAICQYESMMAEQQRLADAEVLLHDPLNTLADQPSSEDQEAVDEQQQSNATSKKHRSKELEDLSAAAPWNTTVNFLGSVQGRTTLKLRGKGDPSGRGEAFSLVKAPGEKGTSNAVANAAGSEYRQDINRIWEAHISSLSSTSGPSAVLGDNAVDSLKSTSAAVPSRLVLSRRFGVDQWINEEITDPLVIRAYLRVRQQSVADSIAEKKGRRGFVAPDALPQLSVSDALPLSIPKRTSTAIKKKKNISSANSASTQVVASVVAEKNLQIRCGACGQVGHMRTNRICPAYSDPTAAPISTLNNTTSENNQNLLKVRLKLSSTSITTTGTNEHGILALSSASSNESIYPSPTIIPVNIRAKGPPIEPISRKPRRKMTAKQIHAHFIASQSVLVRSKLASLSTLLIALIDSLILLPTTLAFHKPVPKKLYPLYYKLVSEPVDLSTIRSRAVSLNYTSLKGFIHDFKLLLENCEKFNGTDSPLSDVARDILSRVQGAINDSSELQEIDSFLQGNLIISDNNATQNDIDVSIMTDQEEEAEESENVNLNVNIDSNEDINMDMDVNMDANVDAKIDVTSPELKIENDPESIVNVEDASEELKLMDTHTPIEEVEK